MAARRARVWRAWGGASALRTPPPRLWMRAAAASSRWCSCCCSSCVAVSSSAVWSSAVWPVTREDLVEGRVAERESPIRTPERASSATAAARDRRRRRRPTGPRDRARDERAELASEHVSRLRPLLRVEQSYMQRPGADRRLELCRRSLGDRLRDRSRRFRRRWSAWSRYWVKAGSSCPRPQRRMMSQTWLRERGSSPVVGSSRHRSGVTRCSRDVSSVMPPISVDEAAAGGDSEGLAAGWPAPSWLA